MKHSQIPKSTYSLKFSFLLLIFLVSCIPINAQTTTFTYQGRLTDNSFDAQGTYQMQFSLFDAVSSGSQVGSTITNTNVNVVNGVFTVQLDFGISAFDGGDRFVEIAVCKAPCSSYTTLNPRQPITSAPYSIKAKDATTATTAMNSTQLGGVVASQYIQEGDSRLTDSRSPTAGSANYIQNGTTQQSSSNFNISGTGIANIISATTQYNIGTDRVFSIAGFNNTFVGKGTGENITTGGSNSFFGHNVGQANTTGRFNSFFGALAGPNNTTGSDNAFFGNFAGQANTTGSNNAFFGLSAGISNETGFDNSFFGESSGFRNTNGAGNSFFGNFAGQNNTASNNSFFGRNSGKDNTTGTENSFFGRNSGENNTNGFFNSFFGASAGAITTTGDENSFFGTAAGFANFTGNKNSFFGRDAGANNSFGSNNSALGTAANVGSNNLNFATAIGSNAIVTTSNTIQLGRNGTDVVRIGTTGSAGTTSLCLNANNEISTCAASSLFENFKGDRIVILYKEQQNQLEKLEKENKELKTKLNKQKTVIDGLLKLVCVDKPNSEICKGVK